MSPQDSIYTSPDALRRLYRNPRNQTGDALIGKEDVAGTIISPPHVTPPVELPKCPAAGQYTMMLVPGTKHSIQPCAVELLRVGIDYLWNPITKTFKVVTKATVIKDQECVKVVTLDKCESIVSLTDRIIQTFEDESGHSIYDLIQDPDTSHRAVSVLDFVAKESEIDTITSVGRLDVVEISVEGGGIYASGTSPRYLTARHNRKDDGSPPDELF